MAIQIPTMPSGMNAFGLSKRRLLRASGPCRVLTSDEVVALVMSTVLSHPPIPFAHRPCASAADRRTPGELLDAIGREIARQAAALPHGGTHAPA